MKHTDYQPPKWSVNNFLRYRNILIFLLFGQPPYFYGVLNLETSDENGLCGNKESIDNDVQLTTKFRSRFRQRPANCSQSHHNSSAGSTGGATTTFEGAVSPAQVVPTEYAPGLEAGRDAARQSYTLLKVLEQRLENARLADPTGGNFSYSISS